MNKPISPATQNISSPDGFQQAASNPDPNQTPHSKKPIYKKWWFWLIIVAVIIAIGGGAAGSGGGQNDAQQGQQTSTQLEETSVARDAAFSQEAQQVEEAEVPVEYANALKKAESYSDLMHMSKQGIYDQLVSEYGEQFSAEAAQYAIDTIDADWNSNALEKARQYQETMAMSPAAIHDQLTSEYGEKFTQEEADYAIANL